MLHIKPFPYKYRSGTTGCIAVHVRRISPRVGTESLFREEYRMKAFALVACALAVAVSNAQSFCQKVHDILFFL